MDSNKLKELILNDNKKDFYNEVTSILDSKLKKEYDVKKMSIYNNSLNERLKGSDIDEFIEQFSELLKDTNIKSDDSVAVREEWLNFVDFLKQDGTIDEKGAEQLLDVDIEDRI